MYINKGKTMRKLYNMIALVLFSSLIFAVDGHHSVSGTVTDADGNALFGANVTVEGTSSGAATGADGSYSVDGVASGTYTCLLYTSPSPRDRNVSRMPSSA